MKLTPHRTWLKIVIYTTPIALGGAAVVALVTLGIPWNMWARYFGSVAIAHLSIWLPAILAFRRAPELSALIWAIFSPVVGLLVCSLLWWPFVRPAWIFGAAMLIFSYGLPFVVSVLCSIIVFRITQNERERAPSEKSGMTTPLALLQRNRAEQGVPPNA